MHLLRSGINAQDLLVVEAESLRMAGAHCFQGQFFYLVAHSDLHHASPLSLLEHHLQHFHPLLINLLLRTLVLLRRVDFYPSACPLRPRPVGLFLLLLAVSQLIAFLELFAEFDSEGFCVRFGVFG